MITDAILKVLFMPIYTFIHIIPVIDFELDMNILRNLISIFSCIGYVLPMPLIYIIFGIRFTIRFAQIIWALVIRVKSFIPTMGA